MLIQVFFGGKYGKYLINTQQKTICLQQFYHSHDFHIQIGSELFKSDYKQV